MNASQFGCEVGCEFWLVGLVGLVGCWLGNCCLLCGFRCWLHLLFVAPLISCTVMSFKIDIDLQVVFQAVKKLFFFQKVKHLAEAIFHVGK